MVGTRILFLEDDELYKETIVEFLQMYDYHVDTCSNGQEFLDKSFEKLYDVFIIDINVPLINGFELLQLLQEQSTKTLKMVLTSQPNTTIKAFQHGSDSYLHKNGHVIDELRLRLRALIRRKYNTLEDHLVISPNSTYHIFHKRLSIDDEEIKLTKIQTLILDALLKNRERYLSTQEILECVYAPNSTTQEQNIRFHIWRLREILGESIILTHRSRGYKIALQD